jgi:hypothetical protein
MGIFANRDQGGSGSSIDEFLSQQIVTPKVFLSPAEGEQYIRVYGQTKYAAARSALVQKALADGKPFWQGKVFLELGESDEDGSVQKQVYFIRFGSTVIGELSEFDRKAQEVLSYEAGSGYIARAVIQDDLIGCLVQLFVNPSSTF